MKAIFFENRAEDFVAFMWSTTADCFTIKDLLESQWSQSDKQRQRYSCKFKKRHHSWTESIILRGGWKLLYLREAIPTVLAEVVYTGYLSRSQQKHIKTMTMEMYF